MSRRNRIGATFNSKKMAENDITALSHKAKFLESEKILLLSLIEDVSDVVESPRTDQVTKDLKNNAWALIAEEYAAQAADHNIYTHRTIDQLKRCWENLKYRCRKADSNRKQYMLKTGGGPAFPVDSEELIHEQVRKIVPHINFTLENPYDSTSKEEGPSVAPTEDVQEKNQIQSGILASRLRKLADNSIDGTVTKKTKTSTEDESQQQILRLKLEILEKEKNYWEIMGKNASLQGAVYLEKLKSAEAQKNYWLSITDNNNSLSENL